MATSGIGAIACWKDLYELSNGASVTNNTDLCPTYSYIVATGYFNIRGSYSSDQLVKYSDISVKPTARQTIQFTVNVLGNSISIMFTKQSSGGGNQIGEFITLPAKVSIRVRWDLTTQNQYSTFTIPAGTSRTYRVPDQLPITTSCTIVSITPSTMVIDGTTYNLIAKTQSITPM